MKILFIAADLKKTGGIEQYNRNLIRSLSDEGEIVEVVEFLGNGIISKASFFLRTFFKAIIFKPQVVFCGHINFSPIPIFLKKILRLPYIVFTHGVDAWNLSQKKIGYLKNAKVVVTVSEFTSIKILNQIGELNNKIFILPNTVDELNFKIADKPKNLIKKYNLEGKKIIFTLGRLWASEQDKGYDRVAKAMPQILEEIPSAVYIIGGMGDDLPRMKTIVAELDLDNKIIFAGFIAQNQLNDFYNLADVYAMPSKQEGFGIVFLEALACGVPVVAGNADGSRNAILNGAAGVLVNPDDQKEIADTIIKILRHEGSDFLYDREYLRNLILKEYGFNEFKNKTKKLLDFISRAN